MHWDFDKKATEQRKASVSAEVLLSLEYDVHFRQHGPSFSKHFLFQDTMYVRETLEVCLWGHIIWVPILKGKLGPNQFFYYVL